MMVYGNEKREVDAAGEIKEIFEEAGPGTAGGAITENSCDPADVCIDLNIGFKTNESIVSVDGQRVLCDKWNDLQPKFKQLIEPRVVQIIVEGHTDDTISDDLRDPELRFAKNWELSSQRATAVMTRLRQCSDGFDPTEFNIVSVGYADTQPRCRPQNTAQCREQNRRTTLRLRYDPRHVFGRLRD
jgi:outer membrane protein OmpA-like peptidoglycan-associated protein